MTWEVYKQFLESEIARVSKQPEDDMRTYAQLQVNVRDYREACNRLQQEYQTLERVLSLLASKEEYERDSIQLQTIASELHQYRQILEENERAIEQKKRYYVALTSEDEGETKYQTLWKQTYVESAIAAVYFAFGNTKRKASELVKWFIEHRDIEGNVAIYLAEMALLRSPLSESETDNEIKRLFSKMAWNRDASEKIDACLRIRQTHRDLERCERLIAEYKENRQEFEAFKESYIGIRQTLENEKNTLLSKRSKGKNTKESQEEIHEWYQSMVKRMEAVWSKYAICYAQTSGQLECLSEDHKKLLQGTQNHGLPWGYFTTLEDNLKKYEEQLQGAAIRPQEYGKLNQDILEGLKSRASGIEKANKADLQYRQDRKRKRAEKYVKQRETLIIAVLILFTYLLGPIGYGDYNGDYYVGFLMKFFPIPITDAVRGENAMANYVKHVPWIIFSLDDMHYIEIAGSDGKSLPLFMVRGGTEIIDIRYNSSLEKAKIPGKTETVTIMECEAIKEVILPSSVKTLEFRNNPKLSRVELPENVESVVIIDCPRLANIELPDSVQTYTYGTSQKSVTKTRNEEGELR